jgi:hypothetical protein
MFTPLLAFCRCSLLAALLETSLLAYLGVVPLRNGRRFHPPKLSNRVLSTEYSPFFSST